MDDRKKIIIMGVLFAFILAVGAFQLKGGPPPPPPKPAGPPPGMLAATQAAAAKKAPAVEPAEPAMPLLTERDPFESPPQADDSTSKPAATPAGANAPAPTPSIKPLGGPIQALPFPGAALVKEGGSPGVSGLPTVGSKGDLKPEPTMAWHVVGVVRGDHPLAILADSTGNQRLIRVGSTIDPDTTLKAVDRSSATFTFRGKTLRLSLVGDQNAK